MTRSVRWRWPGPRCSRRGSPAARRRRRRCAPIAGAACQVADVIDGDTLRLADGRMVHLAGIEAVKAVGGDAAARGARRRCAPRAATALAGEGGRAGRAGACRQPTATAAFMPTSACRRPPGGGGAGCRRACPRAPVPRRDAVSGRRCLPPKRLRGQRAAACGRAHFRRARATILRFRRKRTI